MVCRAGRPGRFAQLQEGGASIVYGAVKGGYYSFEEGDPPLKTNRRNFSNSATMAICNIA
jgi:hypothetical protein